MEKWERRFLKQQCYYVCYLSWPNDIRTERVVHTSTRVVCKQDVKKGNIVSLLQAFHSEVGFSDELVLTSIVCGCLFRPARLRLSLVQENVNATPNFYSSFILI